MKCIVARIFFIVAHATLISGFCSPNPSFTRKHLCQKEEAESCKSNVDAENFVRSLGQLVDPNEIVLVITSLTKDEFDQLGWDPVFDDVRGKMFCTHGKKVEVHKCTKTKPQAGAMDWECIIEDEDIVTGYDCHTYYDYDNGKMEWEITDCGKAKCPHHNFLKNHLCLKEVTHDICQTDIDAEQFFRLEFNHDHLTGVLIGENTSSNHIKEFTMEYVASEDKVLCVNTWTVEVTLCRQDNIKKTITCSKEIPEDLKIYGNIAGDNCKTYHDPILKTKDKTDHIVDGSGYMYYKLTKCSPSTKSTARPTATQPTVTHHTASHPTATHQTETQPTATHPRSTHSTATHLTSTTHQITTSTKCSGCSIPIQGYPTVLIAKYEDTNNTGVIAYPDAKEIIRIGSNQRFAVFCHDGGISDTEFLTCGQGIVFFTKKKFGETIRVDVRKVLSRLKCGNPSPIIMEKKPKKQAMKHGNLSDDQQVHNAVIGWEVPRWEDENIMPIETDVHQQIEIKYTKTGGNYRTLQTAHEIQPTDIMSSSGSCDWKNNGGYFDAAAPASFNIGDYWQNRGQMYNGMYAADLERLYSFKNQKDVFNRTYGSIYYKDFETAKLPLIIREHAPRFERGHLTPNADFKLKRERDATFQYMNAAPQAEGFNQGNWQKLEGCVRNYAKTLSVAGRKLKVTQGTVKTIGFLSKKTRPFKNRPLSLSILNRPDVKILVPQFYWKEIFMETQPIVFVGCNDLWHSECFRNLYDGTGFGNCDDCNIIAPAFFMDNICEHEKIVEEEGGKIICCKGRHSL